MPETTDLPVELTPEYTFGFGLTGTIVIIVLASYGGGSMLKDGYNKAQQIRANRKLAKDAKSKQNSTEK